MKLCYANDQIFPNNETDCEQIIQTVSTLARNGADLDFVLPRHWRQKGVSLAELEAQYGVDLPCALRSLASAFPSHRLVEKWAHALRAVLSAEARRADVLYTRNIPTVVAALLLSRQDVVYETFRNWPDQIAALGPVFRVIGRSPRFLGAVLHSRFAADSYERAGVPASKLFPRHNGYEPKLLEPVLSKTEARTALKLDPERQVVTYTGRVSVPKGAMLLLELAEAIPEAMFLLVGTEQSNEVTRRAQRLKNVRLAPWMPFRKTIPYLYAADVLAIPPTLGPLQKVGNTVLPIKTFVYMATGRAIFGPRSPDLAEVLTHDQNAYLVEPDNSAAALAGMLTLLQDEALRERLAQTAQARAQELTYLQRSRDILDFVAKARARREEKHQ